MASVAAVFESEGRADCALALAGPVTKSKSARPTLVAKQPILQLKLGGNQDRPLMPKLVQIQYVKCDKQIRTSAFDTLEA